VPTVLCDPVRLEQALSNLISNAIKFSPDRTTVKCTTSLDNRFVTISVSDQGPGIAEDVQPFIFDKFARTTSARNPNGTGLGLALTKAIAEAHGGKVDFITEQGHGTTFCLRIPAYHSVLDDHPSAFTARSSNRAKGYADAPISQSE
jgi:signal transduction histidine kinase